MAETILERIETRLQQANIPYNLLQHAPVYTSEEAAAVRGTPLSSGAKALIVKAREFLLLVVPADRKLDSKKARAGLQVKSLRFATREEVLELTTLQPGSIPPFGSVFNLATICDPALVLNENINFNAGDHSISISMTCQDYLTVEQPRLVEIT